MFIVIYYLGARRTIECQGSVCKSQLRAKKLSNYVVQREQSNKHTNLADKTPQLRQQKYKHKTSFANLVSGKQIGCRVNTGIGT